MGSRVWGPGTFLHENRVCPVTCILRLRAPPYLLQSYGTTQAGSSETQMYLWSTQDPDRSGSYQSIAFGLMHTLQLLILRRPDYWQEARLFPGE